MSQISWGKHALILFALFVNLWVGGDLVELWLGRGARGVFEIVLILGYLTLIIGMRAPLPWMRRGAAEGDGASPGPTGDSRPGSPDDAAPPDREHDPWRSL